MGTEQDILLERSEGFVVKRVEMDNHAPARFNELLCIQSEIVELKRASKGSIVPPYVQTNNNKSKRTMFGQCVNQSRLCQFVQYETTSYS